MIVYGDQPRREDPRAKLAALAGSLRDLSVHPPGLARHAALVGALIEAGELAQALADAAFLARGEDAPSPTGDAAMALLLAVAGSAWLSWQSGFAQATPMPEAEIAALSARPMPSHVEPRSAEGFAYYALYLSLIHI